MRKEKTNKRTQKKLNVCTKRNGNKCTVCPATAARPGPMRADIKWGNPFHIDQAFDPKVSKC